MYEGDIDFRKLKLHLQMLPDAVKSTPLGWYTHSRGCQFADDFWHVQSAIILVTLRSAQVYFSILALTCHYSNS